jgi:hypothetical protein
MAWWRVCRVSCADLVTGTVVVRRLRNVALVRRSLFVCWRAALAWLESVVANPVGLMSDADRDLSASLWVETKR